MWGRKKLGPQPSLLETSSSPSFPLTPAPWKHQPPELKAFTAGWDMGPEKERDLAGLTLMPLRAFPRGPPRARGCGRQNQQEGSKR